jgi:DNA-binding transcriptional regulator YbjK
MVANEQRRASLADAGLRVLAREGSRGLTHRAVDREAAVPSGTCSNYFRSRHELLNALAERILVRVAPAPERLADLARPEADLGLFVEYLRDLVERTTAAPELMLALFELRLESTRNPELAAVLEPTLAASYQDDVAFHARRGLPGGAMEVALLHYAVDGLLFDRLTTTIDAGLDTEAIVDVLVRRLVSRSE